MVAAHQAFLTSLKPTDAAALLGPLAQLCTANRVLSHTVWLDLFPQLWSTFNADERQVFAAILRQLLCREHHLQQAQLRPNVIQSILKGVARCVDPPRIPPQLIKYLGKTFNCWHVAISILQRYGMTR